MIKGKKLVLIFLTLGMLIMNVSLAWAQEPAVQPKLGLKIVSPQHVEGYAGKEETVRVQVTNTTDQSIKDILVYITMADLSKNSTVNLEDFNADKPVLIQNLGAKKSKILDLTVRFVYTSQYDLYVTAVSKEYRETVSSASIPVRIIGNTQVDKNQVLMLSVFEPLAVLLLLAGLQLRKFSRAH